MSRVNISNLNIRVTASSEGLAQQLGQSTRQLQGFARDAQSQNNSLSASFANFQKILIRSIALYSTFRAINASQATLIDSVRLAADAEQAAISFEVLLGSAEDAANTIQDIYAFVRTTPFQLEDVQRSARSLAAYGFETDRIIPSLSALGDVASATGNDLFDLVEVYGRTAVEQRLYTKDLNQFTSRGIPLLQELAAQFAPLGTNVEDFTGEIRKMAEDGKLSFDDVERAFASMTSEGGRFFGLTQRQSQTTAGQYSNLKDRVNELKKSFGEGMLPALKEVVAVLDEFVTGSDNAASNMRSMRDTGENLAKIFRIIGGSIRVIQASLNSIVLTEAKFLRLSVTLGGLLQTPASDALNVFIADLEKNIEGVTKSARNLLDLKKPLFDKPSGGLTSAANTLADAVGVVEGSIARARNQMKFMVDDAKGFAAEFVEKYRTPMEDFEEAVRRIIKIDLLTDISDSEVSRFLAAEVERLNAATQELKNTLNDNPANERDSVEAVKTQLRALRGPVGGAANEDAAAAEARIRAEFQAEIDALRAAAEAQAANTSAVSDLALAIRQLEFQLAGGRSFMDDPAKGGPRWSIGEDGKPRLGLGAPSFLNEPYKYPLSGPLMPTGVDNGFVPSMKRWFDSFLDPIRQAVDEISDDYNRRGGTRDSRPNYQVNPGAYQYNANPQLLMGSPTTSLDGGFKKVTDKLKELSQLEQASLGTIAENTANLAKRQTIVVKTYVA